MLEKPRSDAILLSYRPFDGYAEWGLLDPLPNGKMYFRQVRQSFVPENYFDIIRHIGQDQESLIGNTQDHQRPVARVPYAIWNQWHNEDLDVDDPRERQKRNIKRLNDSEYRNLRIGSGRI